jgi:hypothetical protein
MLLFGAEAGAGAAESGKEVLRCEIRVKPRGNMVELEAIAAATSAVQGTYEFRVSKSGSGSSSNVFQQGDFSVSPGVATTLGTAMVGGDGGPYVAQLNIVADGTAVRCSERIDDRI